MGKTAEHGDENEAVNNLDRKGLQSWKPEFEWMQQLGVYQNLAKFLRLQRGDIFLDICSGACPLETELLKTQPGIHTLAIETNGHTNALAVEQLRANGIAAHNVTGRSGDEILCKGPNRDKDIYRRKWDLLKDEVMLLQASINDFSRAQEILEPQKVSAVAYTFSGLSPKELAKANIPHDIPDNPEFLEAKEEHKRSAFALATALTASGGKLLRAERMNVSDLNQDSLELLPTLLCNQFRKKLQKYWDLEDFQYGPNSPKISVATMFLEPAVFSRRIVNAVLLRRNQRPCGIEEANDFTRTMNTEFL